MPGVDAILVGHAHKEIPERFVTNTTTGQQVLLCEPLYWGMRVAVSTSTSSTCRGRWKSAAAHGADSQLQRRARRPGGLEAVQKQHDTVVAYVNSPVGTSAAALSAARAVVEDVPIIDFVQLRPGRRRQGRPLRRRRRAAGALDRRALQPAGLVPGRPGAPCATWPGSTSTTTRCSG